MRKIFFPLLLVSAAAISPASANWFSNPDQGISRNIGSAPNPTPADLRENRQPIAATLPDGRLIAVRDEDVKTASTAEDASKQQPAPAAGSGIAQPASPSR